MAVNVTRVERLRKRQIDGQALKRLVEAGLAWLRTNQQIVNSLNVFPVPDGDTGTNMLLTLTSAYDELKLVINKIKLILALFQLFRKDVLFHQGVLFHVLPYSLFSSFVFLPVRPAK